MIGIEPTNKIRSLKLLRPIMISFASRDEIRGSVSTNTSVCSSAQLHARHCTLPTARYTLNIKHCTLYIRQCTRSAHYTLYSIHCIQKYAHCTSHNTLQKAKCTLNNTLWTLHTAHSTLCIAQCTLHTEPYTLPIYWTVNTTQGKLNNSYYTLHTAYYTLHTVNARCVHF